jgi:hypothetical protein
VAKDGLSAYYRFLASNAKRKKSFDEASIEVKAARKDFLAFREYVCGHPSPAHHESWHGILNTGIDSQCLHGCGGRNTLILSPRGSAKSTFTVEWVAWIIGVHVSPEICFPLKILYVSYSVEVAALKSEQIQEILRSSKYQEVFPWVRPAKRWSPKLWDIDKPHAGLPTFGEPYTLACAGIKGAVASKRAHLVCMDDLIKSPEQIENPAVRERMANNWSNVIRPVMYEGARAVCLGTRMSYDDLYATTFTSDRDWEVVTESAIADNGDGQEVSYWPSNFSLPFLQKLREDDPPAFALQYQNIIPREGQGIIDPAWIQDGTPPPLEEFDALAISSDFSASMKDIADYTVFILIGKIGDQYWFLDMRRGRWSGNIDKCNALLPMLFDWGILETESLYEVDGRTGAMKWHSKNPTIIEKGYYLNFFTESQSYQISFKPDWIEYAQNRLGIQCITCFPVNLRGDKLQRLRGTTGVFQTKRVWFNRYTKLKRLKQEIVGFGSTSKDDCMDAAVLGLTSMGVRPNIEMVS